MNLHPAIVYRYPYSKIESISNHRENRIPEVIAQTMLASHEVNFIEIKPTSDNTNV